MKKKLPIFLDDNLKSYSFHAYISSILLDRIENNSDLWYSNLKVRSKLSNSNWFEKVISPITDEVRGNGKPLYYSNDKHQSRAYKGDFSGISKSDSFKYFYTILKGDGVVQIKIESMKNTSMWAKIGLMLRETMDYDSKYISIFTTPSINGIVIQSRKTKGMRAEYKSIGNHTFPIWLRIERENKNIKLSYGTARNKWDFTELFEMTFAEEINMGMAYCTPEINSFLNWYASNYIQLYSYRDFSLHPIPIDFYVGDHSKGFYNFCPYVKEQTLEHSLIADLGIDPVDMIIKAIDGNNYVDVVLDEYFVPNRGNFNVENFLHSNLIYGYDKNEEIFDIAGYSKNGVFMNSQLTFDQFKCAFLTKDKEQKVTLLSLHPHYIYKINTVVIKKQLSDYLSSIDSLSSLEINRNTESNYVYGVNVYTYLIQNLINIQGDYRPFQVIYEHKKLMVMRINHLYENGILSQEDYRLLSISFKETEQLALVTRNLFLKNLIGQNQRNLVLIEKNLEKIKGDDLKNIPILIESIKDIPELIPEN